MSMGGCPLLLPEGTERAVIVLPDGSTSAIVADYLPDATLCQANANIHPWSVNRYRRWRKLNEMTLRIVSAGCLDSCVTLQQALFPPVHTYTCGAFANRISPL